MSVALTVRNPATEQQRQTYIPVATESFFNEHWVPACQELGLPLVAQFQFGLWVGQDELDEVMRELLKLKGWVEIRPQSEAMQQMLDRVNRLIEELPKIVSSHAQASIG